MAGGGRSRSLHSHLGNGNLGVDLVPIQCLGNIKKKGKMSDTNSQKKEVKKRLSQSKKFESRRRGSTVVGIGGDNPSPVQGKVSNMVWKSLFGGALTLTNWIAP
jgi:hypothetical protein